MGGSDPVPLQTRHVATAGAEMRAFLHVAELWGDQPINFGDLPVYVLTAGDYSRAPGKTEAERRAAWEVINALHEELVQASTSPIREHRVVEGATHYIHHARPEAVLDAARELVERISRSHSASP